MNEPTLTTGEVARQAGVNVETLRYYERRGLLKEPRRRPSGYREYPVEAVQVVRFIKRAQELGFTLKECQELPLLRDDSGGACSDVRAAAMAKLDTVANKIRDLKRIKKALNTLVKSCDAQGSTRECPILESLEGGPKKT